MNGKTAELKMVCEEIFKDMEQKNTGLGEKSYGFHFTYSAEKSWRPDTRLLGVPHPAARFGLYGFPTRDGRYGEGNAPIQKFLREELEKIPS